ncbi:MAG TPA: TetR/AcrR family transcriptional regulator [Firmicutes bacterium]|nr:TetR/AcrR family transcriptional regulator [Bacillota bacterium]
MPKDTFFNLPKEKQERIIEAAIDEFATHPFHQARVTVIAEQAGIAVGSFYQYFEDKKDLYKYLMGLLVEKKLSYINSDMVKNKDKYDFFQILREVYLSGFRFAKENPRLLPIGLMLANDKELYREIFGEYEDQSAEFFQQLLEYGQVQGAIDPAINPKIMGKMLTGMLYSLTDFIMEDGKFDLDDMKIIDQMLYFIENGLRKK